MKKILTQLKLSNSKQKNETTGVPVPESAGCSPETPYSADKFSAFFLKRTCKSPDGSPKYSKGLFSFGSRCGSWSNMTSCKSPADAIESVSANSRMPDRERSQSIVFPLKSGKPWKQFGTVQGDDVVNCYLFSTLFFVGALSGSCHEVLKFLVYLKNAY